MKASNFLEDEEDFNLLFLRQDEIYLLDCESFVLDILNNNEIIESFQGVARLTSKSILFHPCHEPLIICFHLSQFFFDHIIEYFLYDYVVSSTTFSCFVAMINEFTKIPVTFFGDYLRSVSCHQLEKASNGSSYILRLYPKMPGVSLSGIRPLSKKTYTIQECFSCFEALIKNDVYSSDLMNSKNFLIIVFCIVNMNKCATQNNDHSCDTLPSGLLDLTTCLTSLTKKIPSCHSFSLYPLQKTNEKLVYPIIQVELQLPLHKARCIVAFTDQAFYYKIYPCKKNKSFQRLPWTFLQHAVYRIVDLNFNGLLLIFVWDITLKVPQWKELSLLFHSERERYAIARIIKSLCPNAFTICEDPQCLKHFTKLWIDGNFDSYHYLELCNLLSNRTEKDFSQYPIMPWTLINFTSPTLDLTNPENFRDLTKPIGALNQHRLFLLQERMKENCHVSKQCNFLYGNHYSTPGYNVYWLSREIPECLLFLQGGRFDTWPRLFHSLNATWSYLQEGRDGSFMELIPQFYCPSQTAFLQNLLGVKSTCGQKHEENKTTSVVNPTVGMLSDVELPAWSNKSAWTTLKILREALESPLVSENLHHWIDLIFGYKQKGEQAQLSQNIYHPITYLTSMLAQRGTQGDTALKSILSELNHSYEALVTQVQEFGQAPLQLFKKPHPKRQKMGSLPSYDFDTLLTYPRSSYPWYIHVLQNSKLNYFSKEKKRLATNDAYTFAAMHGCMFQQVRERRSLETEEETLLKFKKSQIIYKKESDVKISCLHESSYDSQTFFLGNEEGMIEMLNLPQKKIFPLTTVPITAISSIQENLLLVGDKRGDVRVLKTKEDVIQSKVSLAPKSPHHDSIVAFGMSPKSHTKVFASVSSDLQLGVWVLTSTGEPYLLHHRDENISCLSMQESVLLTGGTKGQIHLWDLRCFHTGPVWEAQGSSSGTPFHFTSCYFDMDCLQSFSFIASHQPNVPTLQKSVLSSQQHPTWHAFLCDIRMLASTHYPIPSSLDQSLTANYSWPTSTSLYTANADGQRWAVGTGVTEFSHPLLEKPTTPSTEPSMMLDQKNICFFASAIDLSGGFRSKEICRWPLILSKPPIFMATPTTWKFHPKHSNSTQRLWVADCYGTIEFIY